jgi:hypothetical protein
LVEILNRNDVLILEEIYMEKSFEQSKDYSEMKYGLAYLGAVVFLAGTAMWSVLPQEVDTRTANHAMLSAAEDGRTDGVRRLLSAGAHVHSHHDYALRYAASNGHLETVKVLLAAGADVHADNDAPLQFAAKNGRTPVVEFLISAGADIHADEDAPLRLAVFNGNTPVVKLLEDARLKQLDTGKAGGAQPRPPGP